MTPRTAETRVLSALFRLGQDDRKATHGLLSLHTELGRDELLPCLRRLHAAGFIDQERLRLTLPGLAVAVGCASRPSPERRCRSAAVSRSSQRFSPLRLHVSRRTAARKRRTTRTPAPYGVRLFEALGA